MLALALGVTAGLYSRNMLSGLNSGPSDSELLATAPLSAEALKWLEENTAPGAKILAPTYMQNHLATRLPGRIVEGYGTESSAAMDLLVVAPEPGQGTFDSVQELAAQSEPLAVFGDGSAVRHILNGVAPRQAHAQRRNGGRALVTNTRIRLTPHAWASLTAGDVDPRLMGLLAHVTADHTIDVSGFPRSTSERGARAPARAMHVSALDGHVMADDPAAAAQLRSKLLSLPPVLRPAEVQLPSPASPGTVLVRFHLPAPVGLLPSPPPPSKGTP